MYFGTESETKNAKPLDIFKEIKPEKQINVLSDFVKGALAM